MAIPIKESTTSDLKVKTSSVSLSRLLKILIKLMCETLSVLFNNLFHRKPASGKENKELHIKEQLDWVSSSSEEVVDLIVVPQHHISEKEHLHDIHCFCDSSEEESLFLELTELGEAYIEIHKSERNSVVNCLESLHLSTVELLREPEESWCVTEVYREEYLTEESCCITEVHSKDHSTIDWPVYTSGSSPIREHLLETLYIPQFTSLELLREPEESWSITEVDNKESKPIECTHRAEEGYKDLLKLISESHFRNYYLRNYIEDDRCELFKNSHKNSEKETFKETCSFLIEESDFTHRIIIPELKHYRAFLSDPFEPVESKVEDHLSYFESIAPFHHSCICINNFVVPPLTKLLPTLDLAVSTSGQILVTSQQFFVVTSRPEPVKRVYISKSAFLAKNRATEKRRKKEIRRKKITLVNPHLKTLQSLNSPTIELCICQTLALLLLLLSLFASVRICDPAKSSVSHMLPVSVY